MRQLGTDLIHERPVPAGEGFPGLVDARELRSVGVDRLELRFNVLADVDNEVGRDGVFAKRGCVDELRGAERLTWDVELLERAQEAGIAQPARSRSGGPCGGRPSSV